MVAMASSTSGSTAAFAPVLAAMKTMRDDQREQKKAAHQFLQDFQKSVSHDHALPCCARYADNFWQTEAWQITIGILQSPADAETKLFAATTLRGKVELGR